MDAEKASFVSVLGHPFRNPSGASIVESLFNPNPCLSTRQKKIFLIQRSRNAWWSRFLDKPTYEATAAAYPVLAPALPIPLYRALKALFETYCRSSRGLLLLLNVGDRMLDVTAALRAMDEWSTIVSQSPQKLVCFIKRYRAAKGQGQRRSNESNYARNEIKSNAP